MIVVMTWDESKVKSGQRGDDEGRSCGKIQRTWR